MEDTAEHLVRNVLPEFPVRQWVLSFPRRVRFLAARHPALASRLLDLFTRAVFTWQRRQARRRGVADPRTGGVTAVQRFGGAINLNVHFPTPVPDGVFDAEGAGPPRFVPVRPPRDEDLAAILDRIVRRTAKALGSPPSCRRRGSTPSDTTASSHPTPGRGSGSFLRLRWLRSPALSQ
jgi:hypothetical protein